MRCMTMTVTLGLVLLGCGKDPAETGQTNDPSNPGTDGGSSTGGGSAETGNPTTGGETGGGSSTGGGGGTTDGAETGGTTCSFICGDDMGPTGIECDVWAQDCLEGQKCMPYAQGGGNAWNATKCVDVMENPGQPGDPCMTQGGGVSGIDNCDKGVMCWNVDPNTMQGICTAQCTGTEEAPECDSEFSCFVSNDGILQLCLPVCDPLVQECEGSNVCIQNPQGNSEFACVLDASGDEGQVFDPCEYINACDAGNFCANVANAMECDANAGGCCLPFCELGGMAACPGVGQTCLPWFTENPPPGYEKVGYCGLMT